MSTVFSFLVTTPFQSDRVGVFTVFGSEGTVT
jgi:hypothetical protein